jgi:hypothetical protein
VERSRGIQQSAITKRLERNCPVHSNVFVAMFRDGSWLWCWRMVGRQVRIYFFVSWCWIFGRYRVLCAYDHAGVSNVLRLLLFKDKAEREAKCVKVKRR